MEVVIHGIRKNTVAMSLKMCGVWDSRWINADSLTAAMALITGYYLIAIIGDILAYQTAFRETQDLQDTQLELIAHLLDPRSSILQQKTL